MLIWSATQVTNKNSALLPVKDSMQIFDKGENKKSSSNPMISLNRGLVNEDRRKDRETLTLLRKDYQLYKDQWGLNVKYSQEAGESKNFSKPFLHIVLVSYHLRNLPQLPRSPWNFKL